jgi:CHAT domain-containing protein
MEDGILTAYEISQMDLSSTELVVLSACETGLGDIKGSEGVYGLQRAFKIAGAKHILMSLWQVPDQQTARLMSLFYKNWLSEKIPVADALRAAQNALRERGYDPFYWAGFVLVE